MSLKLRISLFAFSILLAIITTVVLRKGRIPIKYSLLWYFSSLVVFLVAIFPFTIEFVANMLGQVFVENDTTKKISSPFNSVENIFKKFVLKKNFDAIKSSLLSDENGNLVLPEPVDAIIIDFHAEATSEKMTFTHFVDGKVSAVIGTHTHIPTADTCIFNNGTGFQSDAGMCGDYDSSIGMTFDTSLNLFTVRNPEIRLTVADKSISLCGVVIDINDNTGLTDKIEPFRISDRLSNTHNF